MGQKAIRSGGYTCIVFFDRFKIVMKLVVIMAFEFPKSTKNCARYKDGLFRHVTKVMVFIVCLSPPILHGCDSNMCHQVNLIMVTGKP